MQPPVIGQKSEFQILQDSYTVLMRIPYSNKYGHKEIL